MFFYKLKDKILVSDTQQDLPQITQQEAEKKEGTVYALSQIDPEKSRRAFVITHPNFMFLKSEGIELLKKPLNSSINLPEWLLSKISEHKLVSLNTGYFDWEEELDEKKYSNLKWNINVVGLGDVGGALVTGLRLLGGNCINHIGIYDVDESKTLRWFYEANQIFDVDEYKEYPHITAISRDSLFNCDIFVFCVSAGVPEIGKLVKDVRMAQFEKNSMIIKSYGKVARDINFKGIFAVVSDPVDLLCKSVYLNSNRNDKGIFDNKGLHPDQIRGYGLGVMNARARFFAEQENMVKNFKSEGRVYGPHGEGLIVADSIINYNEILSEYLTEKTLSANLDVRASGFKPYVAPALSSGSLSLIATMEGRWHYSSTFLGGVFMGVRNRLTTDVTEIEAIDMNEKLFFKLSSTYKTLQDN